MIRTRAQAGPARKSTPPAARAARESSPCRVPAANRPGQESAPPPGSGTARRGGLPARAQQPVAIVPAAFERRCIPPDCVVRTDCLQSADGLLAVRGRTDCFAVRGRTACSSRTDCLQFADGLLAVRGRTACSSRTDCLQFADGLLAVRGCPICPICALLTPCQARGHFARWRPSPAGALAALGATRGFTTGCRGSHPPRHRPPLRGTIAGRCAATTTGRVRRAWRSVRVR